MRRRPTIARAKQDLPVDLANSLLASIGDLFYPARKTTPAERKRWAIDQHWYRQRVITWAAAWLNNRLFNPIATGLKTACKRAETVLNLCEINGFSRILSQTSLSRLHRRKSLSRRTSPPSFA